MSEYRFIEPLDVLYLRGNRLFGEPGDHASALMPPWPSVFAGALRSRMLADAGLAPATFKAGEAGGPLRDILGTPAEPGAFTVTDATLAVRGGDAFEALRPLPSDVRVVQGEDGALAVHCLQPAAVDAGLQSSAATPLLALWRSPAPAKAASGYFLNTDGWQAYRRGDPLSGERHLRHADTLWRAESRLGIGLDSARGSVAAGLLYTSDVVALAEGVGFAVAVDGASGHLPERGLLRLGGDGRGAAVAALAPRAEPEVDWAAIAASGRFRLVLTSPGLFPAGWRPPGVDESLRWHFPGGSARLCAASVARAQVVSGWDLAEARPKPAQRCVPTGSVYWFDEFDGDPQSLGKLSATGLWGLSRDNDDPARRAEGFNRFTIAHFQ